MVDYSDNEPKLLRCLVVFLLKHSRCTYTCVDMYEKDWHFILNVNIRLVFYWSLVLPVLYKYFCHAGWASNNCILVHIASSLHFPVPGKHLGCHWKDHEVDAMHLTNLKLKTGILCHTCLHSLHVLVYTDQQSTKVLDTSSLYSKVAMWQGYKHIGTELSIALVC